MPYRARAGGADVAAPSGRPAVGPQLPLSLDWDGGVDFDLFVTGPNAEAVAAVNALATPGALPVCLHGAPGAGKTHLLQALCGRLARGGGTAVYLPLAQLLRQSPDLCEGLESVDVVAVDDGDCLRGQPAWQEAVFHLYNRVRDAGGRFLFAGRSRPDRVPDVLPDLASRLRWGLVFRLAALTDADALEALQRRARRRGLTLSEEVGRYLLSRYPRGTARLFATLDTLDAASLQAGRRLTIPFIRQVLEQPDGRDGSGA